MKDTEQDDDRVMSLVDQTLAHAQEERKLYLHDACGEDLELFSKVWHYVEWEQRMQGFLLEPLYLGHGTSLRPGRVLEGRFRIVREVAQGGMGIVYEAVDEKLGQRIAIKCAKAGFSRRLPPEVRSAREISHPNVCKIFEIHTASTEDGDLDFLVMEFLEGETLAERLRRTPLPEVEIRSIARQLCSGLAEAHRNGVIHGDLKSSNVILTIGPERSMRAVITDFGLARMISTPQRTGQSGTRGGTPDYMAPELRRGEKASQASDVYALGVILHELVFGRRPFPSSGEISPEEMPGCKPGPPSPEWDPILARCLDPLPERRFHDANELRRILTRQFDDRYIGRQESVVNASTRAMQLLPGLSDLLLDDSAQSTVTMPPPEGRSPELRQVTVLSCDLGDCAKLEEQLGLETLRELLVEYEHRCGSIIGTYEGQVANRFDTELRVHFGYPIAYENDAVRAIIAGLHIVDAIRRLQSEFPQLSCLSGESLFAVRVGIHTGQVVAGDSNPLTYNSIVGATGGVASRIQRIAATNAVVISEQTYQLVHGFFEVRYLGETRIPGLAKPLGLFDVVGKTSAEDRIQAATQLTELVSRERELAILSDCWEQAKQGRGRIVLLCGDAGIGKSRLVFEFKERLPKEHATTLECRCSPYHANSPLYPILDLLSKVFRFNQSDTSGEKLRKLENTLPRYKLASSHDLSIFASLFSLSLVQDYPELEAPAGRLRERALACILNLLQSISQERPILLIVEDLHWIDPTTQELLGLMVDQGPTASIMTVLTFRPEFTHSWANRSNLTQLSIEPLTPRESEQMVNRLTAGKSLPRELLTHLIDNSDCTPLFLEEMTKAVLTTGVLRETGSEYELTGPVASLGVPTTLQNSLLSRLDRLGKAKEVAQIASVLGRTFSYELLAAVSPVEEDQLRDSLVRLVNAGLLYRHGLPPDAQFTFKHALIRDAAYATLLSRTRQQCHERIGFLMEHRFPQTAESQPELLAHHFTNAGLHTKAVRYWHQAGGQARKHSANVEAAAHFEKGLEVIKFLPDSVERKQAEFDLWTALGAAELATKGYGSAAVGKAFTQARGLSEQVGESSKMFHALQGLWSFHVVRAELQQSLELTGRLTSVATSLADSALGYEASLRKGISHSLIGNLTAARDCFENVLAGNDHSEHHASTLLYGQDRVVACLCHYSVVLWLLGYADRAIDTSRKGIDLARELGHPFTLSWAYFYAALVHSLRGEPLEVLRHCELLRQLCAEQGFAYRLAQSQILGAWALSEEKRDGTGIDEIQKGISMAQATGAEIFRPYYAALLAHAQLKAGQLERGLTVTGEALERVQRTGERIFESELYRIQGDLIASSGGQLYEKAARRHLKAIAIARKQNARSLELRALISLTQLRPNDPRVFRRLGEFLRDFDEGADNRDIRLARALHTQAGS